MQVLSDKAQYNAVICDRTLQNPVYFCPALDHHLKFLHDEDPFHGGAARKIYFNLRIRQVVHGSSWGSQCNKVLTSSIQSKEILLSTKSYIHLQGLVWVGRLWLVLSQKHDIKTGGAETKYI